MKKVFKISEIDCANCAAKLERAIQKIEGVDNATLNFFAEKLMIEAADEKFASVMEEVKRVTRKMEPDCELEA